MTNRDKAVALAFYVKDGGTLRDHEAVQEGGLSQLLCLPGAYRRDNKILKKKCFEASEELLLDLEMLYMEGEKYDKSGVQKEANKLSAEQAVARLANMLNSDGTRKYSYKLGNKYGPLPSVTYVKGKFSQRKNKGAKALSTTKRGNKDCYDKMKLGELKEACDTRFTAEKWHQGNWILIKILQIDDFMKHGDSDEYDEDEWTGDLLRMECSNRKLPNKTNMSALRLILRGDDLQKKTANHSMSPSRREAKRSTRLTDAIEGRLQSSMLETIFEGALSLRAENDEYSELGYVELERLCVNKFACEMNKQYVSAAILAIDDKLKYDLHGETSMSYHNLTPSNLEEEYNDQRLPAFLSEDSLRILLRG